jgi:hypothetical protein
MGKAVRGATPIAWGVEGRPSIEVERLKGEALKFYLEHRLRELDQQIAILSSSSEWRPQSEDGAGEEPDPAQEDEWELMLDLGYLQASRDAILSALSIL